MKSSPKNKLIVMKIKSKGKCDKNKMTEDINIIFSLLNLSKI